MHGFADANFLGQIGGLQANADAVLELLALPVGIEAEDGDVAAGSGPEAFQNFYGRGLAGAIGPEQAKDFPRLDGEVDSLHGVDVTVGFLEGLHRDRWRE